MNPIEIIENFFFFFFVFQGAKSIAMGCTVYCCATEMRYREKGRRHCQSAIGEPQWNFDSRMRHTYAQRCVVHGRDVELLTELYCFTRRSGSQRFCIQILPRFVIEPDRCDRESSDENAFSSISTDVSFARFASLLRFKDRCPSERTVVVAISSSETRV